MEPVPGSWPSQFENRMKMKKRPDERQEPLGAGAVVGHLVDITQEELDDGLGEVLELAGQARRDATLQEPAGDDEEHDRDPGVDQGVGDRERPEVGDRFGGNWRIMASSAGLSCFLMSSS